MPSKRRGLDGRAAFAANCLMLPDVLTLKEAAAWLRLSERALYDLARNRQVPGALLDSLKDAADTAAELDTRMERLHREIRGADHAHARGVVEL